MVAKMKEPLPAAACKSVSLVGKALILDFEGYITLGGSVDANLF